MCRMMPMFMERGTSLWGFVPDWIYATSSGGQRFHKCLDTIHEFTFKVPFKPHHHQVSNVERNFNISLEKILILMIDFTREKSCKTK